MLARPRGRARWSTTSPASGCSCATCSASRRTTICSPTSTTTCASAFRREVELLFESDHARGPQRARPADRRLHLRERAAGEALRHSRTSTAASSAAWPSPTRRARACSARARILTVTSQRRPHVAGGARQVDSRQSAGHAAAAAAGRSCRRSADVGGQPSRSRCASRWQQHRANPVCASCHKLMDPIGLALENFDAIGRWRTQGRGRSDRRHRRAARRHAGGRRGAAARRRCCKRPDVFVGTLTEKLMTYALGRGVDAPDMPTVRSIVRDAARQNYRFSSLVLGIVEEPAVPDAVEGRSERLRPKAAQSVPERLTAFRCGRTAQEGAHAMFSFARCHLPRRTFLRGLGADGGAAVARRDGAGLHGAGQDRGRAADAVRRGLHPARRHHGALHAGRRWAPGFDFTPILKPLEPFKDNAGSSSATSIARASTTATPPRRPRG